MNSGSDDAANDDAAAATERLLLASRALVAIAARSIAAAEEQVTITQFRVLVVLSTRDPITSAALSELLGTAPSSVTRLCDRLEARGMIDRVPDPSDRRNRLVGLTKRGRRVVDDVTKARRRDIHRVVETLTDRQRGHLITALDAFNEASGEVPDSTWLMAALPADRVGQ